MGAMGDALREGEGREERRPGDAIRLDRAPLVEALDQLRSLGDLVLLKNRALRLRDRIARAPADSEPPDCESPAADDPEALRVRRAILLSEIDQILEAYTLERAVYYLNRLRKGIVEKKTARINDLNLLRWKDHEEILTDSLWVLDRRDGSGAHSADYWGNFIPQIPRQMMRRYTKRGEWVLDAFSGSGTTLIECRRLGRNGLGVELNPKVAEGSKEAIARQPNPEGIVSQVTTGDSRSVDLRAALALHGVERVQLVLLHPPYHDIIRFSDESEDLSNAESTEAFVAMLGQAVENAGAVLEKGRYLALVIGDKYVKGEWIPLGFYCMNAISQRGYLLKSIVVKNYEATRGKRSQKELWRYRALAGGFYVFKHEYVMVFRKK